MLTYASRQQFGDIEVKRGASGREEYRLIRIIDGRNVTGCKPHFRVQQRSPGVGSINIIE
jgi:hypothetical protein